MSDAIDPRIFLKRLPAGQLGMFEPLSGMLLLNVSETAFQANAQRWTANQCTDEDREVIRNLNHESYHFCQTICSGYLYERQCRVFAELNHQHIKLVDLGDAEGARAMLQEVTREGTSAERDEAAQLLAQMAEETDDEATELMETLWPIATSDEEREGVRALVEMLREHNRIARLNARAAPGDHSLFGALMPDFLAYLDQLAGTEAESNQHGLSIISVMEGSAVAHAELLTGGTEGAAKRIEVELASLPEAYAALYRRTVEQCGGRAVELLLPAAAVALRYARPHDAYLPVLQLMRESPEGGALEHGRRVASDPPGIEAAGPILGTAADVHRRGADFRVYASVLADFDAGKWGVDAYTLLADPQAMQRVPSFPIGLLTQDGYRGPMDKRELAARMCLMSAVLRVQGRRRTEREFREWTQWVLRQVLLGDPKR